MPNDVQQVRRRPRQPVDLAEEEGIAFAGKVDHPFEALPYRTDLLDEGLLAPLRERKKRPSAPSLGLVGRMDGSKSEQSRPPLT
jgi:hypothetical protein